MTQRIVQLAFWILLCQGTPVVVDAAGVRGDPESVAAAMRLLEQAGGPTAWSAPVFEVTERIYLTSGEVAEVRVSRDLARHVRLLENTTPSRRITEWLSQDKGWLRRNGIVTAMGAEELAAELQGLRQEPYSIYHRLARNDSHLRVEIRDGGRLFFFDAEERILCWFQVAPNGVLLAWGNFYDGAINQHYYGPVADFGKARLPRFGVSSTGSMRFEYLDARFTDRGPDEPESPRKEARDD